MQEFSLMKHLSKKLSLAKTMTSNIQAENCLAISDNNVLKPSGFMINEVFLSKSNSNLGILFLNYSVNYFFNQWH